MWTVEKPQRAARATYRQCVATVRNPGLRARLQQIEDEIAGASSAFDAAASTTNLSALAPACDVGDVTAAELAGVYTSRFAKLGSAGRAIYDELLLAPVHGRCPLCGHREVATLDHHLPKSRYPALAVAPLNLVPACTDCNKTKLERVAKSREEELLHPYYDDVEDAQWLHAAVVEDLPASAVFFAVPPTHWPILLRERVIHHFETLALSRLYGSAAAVELQNIKFQLSKVSVEAGPAAVTAHLNDLAESRRQAFANSWQTALYAALAQNDWFAAGGFV